jgi:formylmethanofuran dehydrogenase subunit E
MKDIEKYVSMMCYVCGNDQFSALDENLSDIQNAPEKTLLKCDDCGEEFTKEKLIEENKGKIDANLEDLKEEAMKQIQKELKKLFK